LRRVWVLGRRAARGCEEGLEDMYIVLVMWGFVMYDIDVLTYLSFISMARCLRWVTSGTKPPCHAMPCIFKSVLHAKEGPKVYIACTPVLQTFFSTWLVGRLVGWLLVDGSNSSNTCLACTCNCCLQLLVHLAPLVITVSRLRLRCTSEMSDVSGGLFVHTAA
jgi:hypothetical protein